MEPVATIWSALTAVGTSLALVLIVVLALSIVALSLFYLGSAVVVLERFARRARRSWALAIAWLVATLAYAGIAMRSDGAATVAGELQGAAGIAVMVAASGVVTALCMGVTGLGLRRLSSRHLSMLGIVVPGLAFALLVGASARVEYALAPVGAIAIAASLVTIVRRRRHRSPNAGEAERGLRWLAFSLAVAVPIAAALPGEEPRLALGAAGLLQVFFGLVLFGLLPLALAAFAELRRSAEWFVASRYLVARRRQVFISAITFLCTCGIAAGVWLIIVVLSVMNGFEETWRSQIVGNRAHFTVHGVLGRVEDYQITAELVREVPGVDSASPYLEAEGMIRGTGGRIVPVRLRGIDAGRPEVLARLEGELVDGDLATLAVEAGPESGEAAGIILGRELAAAADAKVGQTLALITPQGGPQTPLGPAPRLVRFRVAGIFETSFYQYDQLYAYVSLASAQAFRAAPDVADGIEVRTPDFFASREVAREVRGALGRAFFTRDWKDYFPAFFEALEDNRALMLILLSMVMVVAAFTIVATLLMMIMEKAQDIAILKAMGASEAMIERIFAIEGALIGLAGTLLGVTAGVAVTRQLPWVQDQIEAVTGIDTLPASIYQVSSLPAQIDPVQVTLVSAIAMVLALGATLVPSRQGARIDPVEGLRDV